jgi:hypothetical protein
VRRSWFIGIILGGLLALGAGLVGYQLGVAANISGGSGAIVVAPLGFGFWPFGLLFGFLIFLLVAGLVVGGARRAMRAGGGWGPGLGPGPWGRHGWAAAGTAHGGDAPSGPRWSGPVPPFVEPMLADWHQRAHAAPTPAAPGGGTPATDPRATADAGRP